MNGDLDARIVHSTLKGKGITHLFHANTVATSRNFLQWGGLMSRGLVEHLKLPQTPQSSDAIDKQYGIWNDVFADHVDIHARGRVLNIYGPVAFKMSIGILLTMPFVRVTRHNPTKWSGLPPDRHWFNNEGGFEEDHIPGEFDQMFVFRTTAWGLKFFHYLEEVIVDDPQRQVPEGSFHDGAIHYLQEAVPHGVQVRFTKRVCGPTCRCLDGYKYWSEPALRASFLA